MNPNKSKAKEYYLEAEKFRNGQIDFNKAMVLINKAINLDPDEANFYSLRSILNKVGADGVMTDSGLEKSIADNNKEIELNPDSNAYFLRTQLYILLGKLREALTSIEEMLVKKSDDSYEDDKQISKSFLFSSLLALSVNEYKKAKELLKHYFDIEGSSVEEMGLYEAIYKQYFENTSSLTLANKELKEKENELEEMMAMFAHKFRGPLDMIIYNSSHENRPKLYMESAQIMRGLLDFFSVISTDSDNLKARLKQDTQGKGDLLLLLRKAIDMILLHLLSAPSTEKVQQHYMNYAKAHDLCEPKVSRKSWNENNYELEQQLQNLWEQDYANLIDKSDELPVRLAWIEQHFFKLELRGFDTDAIQFRENGYKESLLMILLNEVLVNAFKFYDSAEKLPVTLEWAERGGYQFLICHNPSTRSERGISKGSHKGHAFVSALARKTGSQFVKPEMKDDFIFEYGFPNEILIANQEEG